MLDDRLEQRRHVFAVLVDLAHREAVLRARVNDRKIELLVGRFQLNEEIEDHVEHLVRARVLAVDLVDDDDRFDLVLERFAQNETRLRLRSIVRIDDEQDAIDHLHDALDLAAEIRVTGRIDDVDAVAVPLERGILRADRDPLLALEIHRVHHPLLDLLIGTEGAGLPQQLIDERGLAVIDVRNDGDVTNLIHGTSPRGERGIWRQGRAASNDPARLRRNRGFALCERRPVRFEPRETRSH